MVTCRSEWVGKKKKVRYDACGGEARGCVVDDVSDSIN